MSENHETESIAGLADYAVATPYFGGLDVDHNDCKLWLQRDLPELKHYRIVGCPYIDMARAALVRLAELKGHKGIVFIDHDILFQPVDVLRLIKAAEEKQAIVSGVYCMRKSGDRLIAGFAADVPRATFFKGGGLYPGAWSGLGFTAIPWSAIEKIVSHHGTKRCRLPMSMVGVSEEARENMKDADLVWPLFALDTSGEHYQGEDISFIQRARAAGVPLYLDTRPALFHKGSYRFGVEDAACVVPRGETLEVEFTRELPPLVAVGAERFEGLSSARGVEGEPVVQLDDPDADDGQDCTVQRDEDGAPLYMGGVGTV